MNENAKIKKAWYKKWWVWVIAVVVIGAIAGGGGGKDEKTANNNQPSTSTSSNANTGDNETKTEATPTPEPKDEVIEVDYKKLHSDYMDNPISADKEYKGKLLKVTGNVDSIDREISQATYITFNLDQFGLETIRMTFKRSEEDKVASLSKGQSVTVIGKCDGTLISTTVALKDCYIAE